MGAVLDSYARVKAEADLVLIEGAGSAAEINLREGDIANMGFARAAGCPVVLIGDIDRGGIFAQILGVKAALAPEDAATIVGFIVNKFRGDASLFLTAWRQSPAVPAGARSASCRSFPTPRGCRRKTRSALAGNPAGGRRCNDRRADAGADRQFRRFRPAPARSGGSARFREPGRAVANRRSDHPPGAG